MAARAGLHIRRIVTAERTRPVVTRGAIVSRSGVFLRCYCRDLAPLRTGSNRMTIGTVQALRTGVIGMTEHCFEDISAGRRAAVRLELVTDIAGPDLAFGRVTGKAIRVGRNAYRKRLTRTGGFMARRTAFGRSAFAGHVRGMHEFHVEALDELRRKLMHGRRHGLHVLMADRAHCLLLRICELADMTADTRIMTGEFQIERRRTFTPVARITFELFVFWNAMREGFESFVGSPDWDRLGCFGSGDGHLSFICLLDTADRSHPDSGD